MDERLTLQKRIEVELKSYDGKMGIYISDLKGNHIVFNEYEKYETASTIKVFILAALYLEVEEKRKSLSDVLAYEPEFAIDGSGILSALEIGTKLSVKNLATLMIIVSDNIATNILIDYLGIELINQHIQAFGCYDTVLHNVLNFETYHQLGTTTPHDYAYIFEQMAQGKLVSEKASQEMLAICKMQHYNIMLTKYLPQYYMDPDNYEEELFFVASKSGSMNACRNDGGIVSTPYGKYVIVMLHKDFHDKMYYQEHPAIVFGAKISRLVFDQFLAKEGCF